MTLNGAIMQLVEMRENSMMPVVLKPYFDKVIETISECVEPSEIPHWIPCSERLPDKNGDYLVTGRQGAVNSRRYEDGRWYGGWSVLAWMPLPEAYKEGREDHD